MRRFISASFLTALVLFPLFGYTYLRGCTDGVARYQKSRRFALTLYSMYRFGLVDGKTDRINCLNEIGQWIDSSGQCWEAKDGWDPCKGGKK